MSEILVVEDSDAVRETVQNFLQENGFDVIGATNGRDGLEKLESHPEIKLIFTDINMKEMDGITMIEKIRHEMNNQNVHIMVFTNEHSREMKKKVKGMNLNIKGWIIKPFDGDGALPFIKHLINTP